MIKVRTVWVLLAAVCVSVSVANGGDRNRDRGVKGGRVQATPLVRVEEVPFSIISSELDSECARECFEEAVAMYRACLDAGGTRETCATEARAFLETCLLDRCGEEIPCRLRCGIMAERAYRECRANGGTQEDCGTLAHRLFRECVEANCIEPPTCQDECHSLAQEVFEVCIDNGDGE